MHKFGICFFLLLSTWVICKKNRKHIYDYQPQQVHLAYGENPLEIIVTWSTMDETPKPTVEYGVASLDKASSGTSTKFIDGGKEKRSQFIHRVLLTGLLPQTKYFYHCGSSKGWSNLFWFRTYRNDTKGPVRFAIYGDLGSVNAVSLPQLQEEVQKDLYDAVFHVGDFAYDMKNRNGRVGDEFMRQLEPLAAYVPYMVCPGNHEHAYNFSHYRERFSMPMSQYENLWYSFNLGPIHFVSINTEAYYFLLDFGIKVLVKQYDWLTEDLKAANRPENRAVRPWIILYGHRPMYCSNVNKECVQNESFTRTGLPVYNWFAIEPLLYEFGVDLVFWGHKHSYERLWPVYDFQVKNGSKFSPYTNPKATVHITTGSAGCKELTANFTTETNPWSSFRSAHYGYSKVHVYNSSHLHVQQISVDPNLEIVDEMWLIKDKHGSFNDLNK